MLKRQTERTPAERRSRRIRFAALGTGAALVLALLFAVLYVGLTLARKNTPKHLALAVEPKPAWLLFSMDAAIDEVTKSASGENRRAAGYLVSSLRHLRPAFAEHGQMHFWRDADGGEHWLLHLPIVLPTRVHMSELRSALAASPVLAEVGTEGSAEAVAFYQLTSQRLLVSSTPRIPFYQEGPLLNQWEDGEHNDALLKIPGDYLPAYIAKQAGQLPGDPPWEIKWTKGNGRANGLQWRGSFLPLPVRESAS